MFAKLAITFLFVIASLQAGCKAQTASTVSNFLLESFPRPASANVSGWTAAAGEPCAASEWTGITCRDGAVVGLELAGEGLSVPLPPALFDNLPLLEALNLSNNAFSGSLPASWRAQSLKTLDVSSNSLSGPLPASWAEPGAFPALASIALQLNKLSGPLPQQWNAGAFSPGGAIVKLRPGNQGVCGSLPFLNPADISPTATISQPIANRTLFFTGNQVIINTLGSCAVSCKELQNSTSANPTATTAIIKTNIFDLAWQNGVSVIDVVRVNPQLAFNGGPPGDVVTLPCYPDGYQPTYFGSDAAVGQFISHPHSPTKNGTAHDEALLRDAALAGALVLPPEITGSYPGNSQEFVYTVAPVNGTSAICLDLQVNLTLMAVQVSAGNTMRNLSVYIGDTPLHSNGVDILIATGIDVQAGSTVSLAFDHPSGRYVSFISDTDPLSLTKVSAWPQVTDVALEKTIETSSSLSFINSTSTSSLGTSHFKICSVVNRDALSGKLFISVDLGYEANVIMVVGNPENIQLGSEARVFVADSGGVDGINTGKLCRPETEFLSLTPGIGNADNFYPTYCNATGRYVIAEVVGQDGVVLCDLEVYIAGIPRMLPEPDNSAGNTTGTVIGAAVGGSLLIAFVALGVAYWRWRKHHAPQRVREASVLPGTKDTHLDIIDEKSPSISDPENPTTSSNANHSRGSGDAAGNSGSTVGSRDSKIASSGSKRSSSSTAEELRLMRTFISQLVRKGSSASKGGSSNSGWSASLDEATDLSRFGQEWNIIDFSELEILNPIGEGSFGVVHAARYLQTPVAVKLLTMDMRTARAAASPMARGSSGDARPMPSAAILDALQKEAGLMANLRHPNCVQYIGAVLDPPALVLELCPRRSVDCLLSSAAAEPQGPIARQLTWRRLLSMASDAAKGVLYLHSCKPPVIHRDLKSPNLLVDSHWRVKVSDFNLSRAVPTGSAASSLHLTNPRWLSPEILKGGEAGSIPADVWGFGCILWELMTFELPWESVHNNHFSIISAVTSGATLPIPPPEKLPAGKLACYDEYVALMKRCWAMAPEERPSMAEVAQQLRAMLASETREKSEHGGGPSATS